MKTWQLQSAKAQLSRLIQNAMRDGPQQITIHGTPRVIVMNKNEYDRLTKSRLSFIDFILQSPLVGANIKIKRNKSLTRDVDL